MSTFHFLGRRRICSALLETLVGGDEVEGPRGWLANSKIDLFRMKKSPSDAAMMTATDGLHWHSKGGGGAGGGVTAGEFLNY